MSDLRTRPLELVSAALDTQIADYLTQLLGPARPRRVARMSAPGELRPETDKKTRRRTGRMVQRDKYEDIRGPLTRQMLQQHARGTVTYSCTLDQDGMSDAGAIDVDAGGRSVVWRVLQVAQARGRSCYAVVIEGPDHSGGHIWFRYAQKAPAVAIAAELRAIATAAGLPEHTEIWPQNQGIRSPFGVHQVAKTRGELLTQAGELIDLDADLAQGIELVLGLLQNEAPPAVSTVDAVDASTKKERRISLGELSAERFDRERFNRDHPLEQLLCDWGAVATAGGFSCPCGVPHSHTTTLYISRLGKLFSYSTQCKLYTTKGYDAFGFYVKTQHGDDIAAALRTLNPIGDRRSNSAPARNLPEYVLSPEERTHRAAEAQRKKAARRQHAAETIADVRARAATDFTLRTSDRAVLDTLLTIAGDRSWCRPSKERIAELSGVPLGTVKRVLFSAENGGRLEGRYFVSEGDGGGPKATAIRTFLRGSFSPSQTDEMIHESLRTCDLVPDSRACERGGDPHQPDRELLSCVRELAGRAAEPGWETRDYAELDDAGLEVEADRLLAVVAAQLADGASGEFPQVAKSEIISDSQIENPDDAGEIVTGPAGAVAIVGGAAYVPKGAESWYQAVQIPKFVGICDQAGPAQLLDLTPEPEPAAPAAPARRRRPCEISVIDRYRLDLAGMEETALAGELKKHHRTLKKHAGAHWLDQVRAKLDLVQAEIDVRELGSRAGAELPHLTPAASVTRTQMRRRRGASLSAEIPRMAEADQLVLDLVPIGNRAGGFARALVEGSPPLTSS
jgi:hypothetical protein